MTRNKNNRNVEKKEKTLAEGILTRRDNNNNEYADNVAHVKNYRPSSYVAAQ